MRGEVRFIVQVPGCTKCGRGPDTQTSVRFDLNAKNMLQAAGFMDWAIWEDKPTLEVADHFEMLWAKMNKDAYKYAELAKRGINGGSEGDAWYDYGHTMNAMRDLAAACRENPHGFVKVAVQSR